MSKQAPPRIPLTRRPALAQAVLLVALALLWGCGPDPAPTATDVSAPAPPTATTGAGNGLLPITAAAGLTPTGGTAGPSPVATVTSLVTPGSSAPLGLLKHHDLPPGGVQRQMDFGGGMGGGAPGAFLRDGDQDVVMPPTEIGDYYAIDLANWAPKTPVQARFTYPDGQIVRETRTTDDQGYATLDWVSLPGEPLGRYTITILGGGRQATGNFLVQRATTYHASALPQRGPAGTTFRIALAGLPPQVPAPIFVYRQSADKSSTYVTLLTTLTTNANGEALASLPTASGDPAGHYLVVTSPDLAGAELEVTGPPGGPPAGAASGLLAHHDSPPAGIDARVVFELGNNYGRSLDPSLPVAHMAPVEVANPGGGVFLSGFVPGQEVTGQFTYPDGRLLRETAVIDADGTGALDWVSLPGEPLGRYEVTATQGKRVARGNFLVQRASRPAVAVRPGSGPPGTTFQVAAAGYPAGGRVLLYVYRTANSAGTVDFVAALPVVQADSGGEALLSLPTSADDAAATYIILRDDDARASFVKAAGGRFTLGNPAP